MWEGRKKTSQKQKCNLEAVLRGITRLSNRLLVMERCFCVALHKPLMWMDTCFCRRSVLLTLNWTSEGCNGMMGHFNLEIRQRRRCTLAHIWAQNKPSYLKLHHYLIISQYQQLDPCVMCGKVNTAECTSLPRFIVCKSCTSRCLIINIFEQIKVMTSLGERNY